MILADIIIIVLLVIFCLFGMLFGFGKGLKFFTSGFIGLIISIFVCYALGGLIYKLSFVQDILNSLRGALEKKGNGICNFLLKIQIDIIVYYVALFIAVTIIRIITVKIIQSIVEIENLGLIIINKAFGIVLFVGVLLFLVLLVFWVISLIGGGTAESFTQTLARSKIGLDKLYANNPFLTIIKVIKIRITKTVT